MYDFFFYFRNNRWPNDPWRKVRFVAATYYEAWLRFEAAYPPSHFYVCRMEHNMYDTSLFCRG